MPLLTLPPSSDLNNSPGGGNGGTTLYDLVFSFSATAAASRAAFSLAATTVAGRVPDGARTGCEGARGDGDGARRIAHSLKGVAASFGLDALTAVFLAIETDAHARDEAAVRNQIEPVNLAADKAKAALMLWLARKKFRTGMEPGAPS